jgi:pimeloyl-ACP methyl ester carboxylesterase
MQAALLDYLKIRSADLIGYSMGGGVAMQCAIRHPEKVRKVVSISAVFRHGGWVKEALDAWPGNCAGSPRAFAMKTSSTWRRADVISGRVNFRASANFLAQRFDAGKQIFLARDASDLIAQLAILEKKQSWDGANIVLDGETLVFVHVNFCHPDRVRFFARNLIQQRRDHFTGTAPFRPKIDDHGFIVLRHFAVKV